MKDTTFALLPAAETGRPPFTYSFCLPRSRAFIWHVRDASGRAMATANTRAGVRAARLALYGRSPLAGRDEVLTHV